MAAKPLPSADYLRECFVYDPDSGSLTWHKDRPREHFRTARGWRSWTTKQGGKPAGSIEANGYPILCIDYRLYKAHRVIWKLMTGDEPAVEIDHRNGNRADNRWCNLREATKQQNMWNSPRSSQRPLPKGVYAKTKRGVFTGRYSSKVHYNGKVTNLGYFDTPEEASAAYRSFTQRLHGEFHRSD